MTVESICTFQRTYFGRHLEKPQYWMTCYDGEKTGKIETIMIVISVVFLYSPGARDNDRCIMAVTVDRRPTTKSRRQYRRGRRLIDMIM